MSGSFYAVCLPGDDSAGGSVVPATDGQPLGQDLVFEDREQALKMCKKFKGARFKCFTSRAEAELFVESAGNEGIGGSNGDKILELPSEKLPFPGPGPQDLLELRRTIERGDAGAFSKMVWGNPRYLIGAGDTPTMVRERYRYHSLLMAAFSRKHDVCKAVLETVTDPRFFSLLYTNDTEEVRASRMSFLLDMYLNTTDKFHNETPLHFASKFGSVDTVELLISFPQCDREARNKDGKTAADIAGKSWRGPSGGDSATAQVLQLLDERYFVPVLRAADHTAPAQIGRPCTPDQVGSGPPQQPKTPAPSADSTTGDQAGPPAKSWSQRRLNVSESPFFVQALAGPMSPQDAQAFYEKLKTPPVRTPWKASGGGGGASVMDSRLSDMDKGVERVARGVAKQMGVPWSEYWPFLGEFHDLTSEDGLRALERHLALKHQLQPVPEPLPKEQIVASPLTELCLQLSELRLKSPPASHKSQLDGEGDCFRTPPSTPPSPDAVFHDFTPFFICTDDRPTKADVDVLRAIDGCCVPIEADCFPNISMWMENMNRFSNQQLSSLRTPAALASGMKLQAQTPVSNRHDSSAASSAGMASCLAQRRSNLTPRLAKARKSLF